MVNKREKGWGITCPECGHPFNKVTDSRAHPTSIYRKRVCDNCGNLFRTVERMEVPTTNVVVDSNLHVT